MWRRKKAKPADPTPKPKPAQQAQPLRWGRVALTAGVVIGAGVLIIGGLVLYHHSRQVRRQVAQVIASEQQVTSVRIQINRPAWMPLELARSIASALAPRQQMSYDREQLAPEVYARAIAHPMIRQVQPVRRQRTDNPQVDAVVVTAEFRRPVARAAVKEAQAGLDGYVCVDSEGVRLPVDMVPAWVRPGGEGGPDEYFLDSGGQQPTPDCRGIHYILITGVQAPVPGVGRKWEGQDLADGIRLVELVSSRPWANQVTSVDVGNYGGRADPKAPEMTLTAQKGQSKPTLIRFGRFPLDDEPYMVPTDRKLAYLDAYAQQHEGSIAGLNDWVDLRYDRLHVSLQ